MAIFKKQTLDSDDYTSQLYLINTYYNIYLDYYTLDFITIEDLKPLLRYCTFFIQKKVANYKKNVCKSH